jgi:transposase-like protein
MSQRGRERDVDKERVWRDAIRRWHSSGQTIRGFCRQRGLSEAAFHAWRRTIARRDERAVPAASPERRPTFVPLRATPPPAAPAAAPLELVLGAGRVVRVSPGFDAATLQALLAALEEQPSC